MSFGTNLEKLRRQYKLSQAKLGNALGISQQMISCYEQNLTSPNIESLIKISDFFHMSIDQLIDHKVVSEDSTTPFSQS